MNKYGQYCPMARAVEILGDRWTLLIVRDLICGAHHFNQLERGLPGISRALLADRLKRLQQVGIIELQTTHDRHRTCYSLTQAGWELYPIVDQLTQWGAKWAFGDPEPSELNPVLLLWWMRDRVHHDRLPQRRVVIEFDFLQSQPRRMWLVLRPGDVSVCVSHPGFEIDILVTAELSVIYQVWLGRLTFSEARSDDRIRLEAEVDLTRAFPSWFALSVVSDIVKAAMPVRA